MIPDLEKYRALYDSGLSLEDVCRQMKADGVGIVECVGVLRRVSSCDLRRAKEAYIAVDGRSLEESQEWIAGALPPILEEMEAPSARQPMAANASLVATLWKRVIAFFVRRTRPRSEKP